MRDDRMKDLLTKAGVKGSTMVTIFTDGACEPNPGRGGWAWCESLEIYDAGAFELTTNNEMELMAIYEAMQYAIRVHLPNQGVQVVIKSDSRYCVNGYNDWMHTWQSRGWKKSSGQLANREHWIRFYKLWKTHGSRITLKWVKGHNGTELNEFADQLAVQQIGK